MLNRCGIEKCHRGFKSPPLRIFIQADLGASIRQIRNWKLFNFITTLFAPHAYFYFASFILVLINFPYWDQSYWFQHDTTFAFQLFYTFYNNFFFHGELARWIPFGSYGLQADKWQLSALTPAGYLASILGALLQFKNVLLIFKWSVLLEQLTMLFGTYLLAKKWFMQRGTVLFCCLCMVATTYWPLQLLSDLRSYYFYPFILYFITLFFRNKQAHYLWISGIFFVMWQLGTSLHTIGLLFLMSLFFFIGMAFKYPFPGRAFFNRSKKNILWFLLFIVIFGTYLYFSIHLMKESVSTRSGRDALTQVVEPNNFLNLGRSIGWGKFLGLISPSILSTSISGDFTLYVGLLPLFFLFYGIVHSREKEKIALLFPGIFIILFSLGSETFVARLTYDLFPPIRICRYIGANSGGFIRVILIFIASFGLDRFLSDRETLFVKQNKKSFIPTRVLLYSGFLLAAIACASFVNQDARHFPIQWPGFIFFSTILFVFTIIMIYRFHKAKIFLGIIFFGLLADLLTFQGLASASWPSRWPKLDPSVSHVSRTDYQAVRSIRVFDSPRAFFAYEQLVQTGDTLAIEMFNFLQFDHCAPRQFENYLWNQNVATLIFYMNPVFFSADSFAEFVQSPKSFLFACVIGCADECPKLKLITDVYYVDQEAEANALLRIRNDYFEKIILEQVPQTIKSQFIMPMFKENNPGAIQVVSYSYNRLKAKLSNVRKGGAWLYYADAYHSGWRAYVDGKQIPIFRANRGFKAIFIEPGEHEIEFVFRAGLLNIASHFIAIFALIFSVSLIRWMFLTLRS